jgi:hypothetical protein
MVAMTSQVDCGIGRHQPSDFVFQHTGQDEANGSIRQTNSLAGAAAPKGTSAFVQICINCILDLPSIGERNERFRGGLDSGRNMFLNEVNG